MRASKLYSRGVDLIKAAEIKEPQLIMPAALLNKVCYYYRE